MSQNLNRLETSALFLLGLGSVGPFVDERRFNLPKMYDAQNATSTTELTSARSRSSS